MAAIYHDAVRLEVRTSVCLDPLVEGGHVYCSYSLESKTTHQQVRIRSGTPLPSSYSIPFKLAIVKRQSTVFYCMPTKEDPSDCDVLCSFPMLLVLQYTDAELSWAIEPSEVCPFDREARQLLQMQMDGPFEEVFDVELEVHLSSLPEDWVLWGGQFTLGSEADTRDIPSTSTRSGGLSKLESWERTHKWLLKEFGDEETANTCFDKYAEHRVETTGPDLKEENHRLGRSCNL